MRKLTIVILSIFCFAAACKPLAQREEVSTEQMLAMRLPRFVNAMNELMERAIEIGRFDNIRDIIDKFLAQKKVAWLEAALNRQLFRGREEAIKKVFQSYVVDDAAQINKTFTNIATAQSTANVKKQLRKNANADL